MSGILNQQQEQSNLLIHPRDSSRYNFSFSHCSNVQILWEWMKAEREVCVVDPRTKLITDARKNNTNDSWLYSIILYIVSIAGKWFREIWQNQIFLEHQIDFIPPNPTEKIRLPLRIADIESLPLSSFLYFTHSRYVHAYTVYIPDWLKLISRALIRHCGAWR